MDTIKTDDEIYNDYINTFNEDEREILRPHLKETYGFHVYRLSVRGNELGEAIKEATRKTKLRKNYNG